MQSPRLLILSFSPIRSDARVLKQVQLLKDRYRVTTCGYGSAPDGVEDHVEIPSALVAWHFHKRSLIAHAYERAYWSNPVIAHLRTTLTPGRYDAVLANDIETAGLASWIAPVKGFHLDLHEYSPRMKEEVLRWRCFLGPFMSWMVRRYGVLASSTTTVGARIAEEYGRKFRLEAAVVTNAAPFVDCAPSPVGDPIRLVHSGAAKQGRHLDVTLDAMAAIRSNATLALYLTQNEGAYFEGLRRRIEHMPNVTLHPPVAYEDLPATLNSYDVGVFLLPPVNFNHRWALPNKFFDFVQARLGIVMGPSPEAANLLKSEGLGVVAEDFTAASFASAIDSLNAVNVSSFKQAAHDSAERLAAAEQVKRWGSAIDALFSGSPT
ncbi:glycosyltransferase family 1 protein [Arthrobacter sp. EH-1B-1]|uniref:Glycosyltransferase family 1 protein n=1 Tax=Arthrobacter vasquezii TaxID=2977629 RepID=A0ABT6CV04_9MICC|nr:glycosyltransferase family 1 protein [Arthrobacter vasquezii]MDF9277853.1 glycosyltransferase family 1 protein [Arthrobacter vasquezii]